MESGTLINAAQTLREKGAFGIYACCVHPVLSGETYRHLAGSSIKKLIVADTIRLKQDTPPMIEVVSIAGVLAKAVDCAVHGKSLNKFFDDDDNKM